MAKMQAKFQMFWYFQRKIMLHYHSSGKNYNQNWGKWIISFRLYF